MLHWAPFAPFGFIEIFWSIHTDRHKCAFARILPIGMNCAPICPHEYILALNAIVLYNPATSNDRN